MIPRILTIQNDNSFFLFGPRGTGKTTWIETKFPPDKTLFIDLLSPKEEAVLSADPEELIRRTEHLPRKSWIVIDEVQKVPSILDVVHSLIEKKGFLFALTGSSARKLKRGSANLLAGRAFVYELWPMSYIEVEKDFDLQLALSWGTLPKILQLPSDVHRRDFLEAYAQTYLKEEIQLEQIVRNLPSFRRFLAVAAQMSGKPINLSKVGRDISVDHSVVRGYYEILEDTLIGFLLPAYEASVRKQQRQAHKFFFCDTGIRRALDQGIYVPLQPSTYEYGRTFEEWLIAEVFKLVRYSRRGEKLFYLQTKDGAEVDLIINRPGKKTLFVEIKSSQNVHETDARHVLTLAKDTKNAIPMVISLDPHRKTLNSVPAMHWSEFLKRIWAGEFK